MVCAFLRVCKILSSFSFRKCCDSTGIVISNISAKSQTHNSLSSLSRYNILLRTSLPERLKTWFNRLNDISAFWSFFLHSPIST